MAKASEILGIDRYIKIRNEAINLGKSDDEITAIIKSEASKLLQTKEQNQSQYFNTDSKTDGAMRGAIEATARGLGALNYLDDKLGNHFISDEFSKNNAKVLDTLEKRRETDSKKGLSGERLAEIKKLETQSANATGIIDTLKTSGNQLIDDLTHPSEWTTQGIVANFYPTDPANLVDAVTGGIAGKVTRKLGGGLVSQIGFGIGAGALSGGGVEYAVAKGTHKSDSEAQKAGIVGGVFGATLGGTVAGVSGVLETRKANLQDPNKPNEQVEAQTIDDLKKENNHDVMEDDKIAEVAEQLKKNTLIKDIQKINDIETTSTKAHEKTKQDLQTAYDNGATKEELETIKRTAEVTPQELELTKMINNDMEIKDNSLVGMRIVNKLEATLETPNLPPEMVYKKLVSEGVGKDLANAFTQSFKEGTTETLIEFISNKTNEKLTPKYQALELETKQIAQNYNAQLEAHRVNHENSIPNIELDGFIKEISDGSAIEPDITMLKELNKLGLVTQLTHQNIKNKFKVDGDGAYTKSDGKIAIDDTISPEDKMIALQHEYIHSASAKLMDVDPTFKDAVTLVMDDFRKLTDDTEAYAFESPQEFVAVAYSDPHFAKKMNDTLISDELRMKLSIPEQIKSVWDYVVGSFIESVATKTGRRITLDKDSHFATLDKIMAKKLQDFEDLKTKSLEDGSSLENLKKEPIIKDGDTLFSAKAMEDRYIKNNRLNVEKLVSDSNTELPAPIKSYEDFVSQFDTNKKGDAILKTPIGDVIFNPRKDYDHFTNNTNNQDRTFMTGAFKETFTDPLFVVEQDYKQLVKKALKKGEKDKYNIVKQNIFYKAFKTKDDHIHLSGYAIDKDGAIVNTTYFDLDNKDLGKLKKLIRVNEKDLKYFKHSPLTKDGKSTLSGLFPSKSANESIIPKDDKKSQDDILYSSNSNSELILYNKSFK